MTDQFPQPGVTPAREATAQLFRRYGDAVFRLGLGMCRSAENAEDLVQETFFRALRGWPSFEGRAKVTTWLYTIASRACRRMERRRAGEPRELDRYPDQGAEGGHEPTTGPGPDPLDQLTRDQARMVVRQTVATLPAAFRLPLLLKDLEGLSVAQVAEVLDLKPATVKTRVHRARLILGRKLGASAPPPAPDGDDHTRRECLDLIQARQEAYDRGVPFPLSPEVVCERCRPLFHAMNLSRTACDLLVTGQMPDPLRRVLRERLTS